ncbi:E3 ubiquitin-protein ligase APD2-like [Tasmannia lanceolata]|uniref:E3 ubiquitin-protein ligase APD2-like n=1 Tax=Tasmannia lanceolata TaxID=3420 RepID=UPI004063454B
MHRPSFSSSLSYPTSSSRQVMGARIVVPLTLWIFVSLSLRYGYYGNYQLVLGPNSSRLLKASSLFVDQIQVRDKAKKGLLLYGLLDKPELSLETHWNVSNNLFVESYCRQGFSLWLNQGSRIRIKWEVQGSSYGNLVVVLIKGEHNFETLLPYPTYSHSIGFKIPTNGKGEAEYIVEEDDSYFIGVVNLNPQSITAKMRVGVSSKIYDTTKSKTSCSTTNGFCRLKLLFPNTHYVVLTTPNNGGIEAWYVELSYVARLVTYIAILGLVVIIVFLILKYLGACERERAVEEETETRTTTLTETDPLLPEKEVTTIYGTSEEDPESGLCGTSEELYDGKICAICYDERRNCFFIPCGHCATCYTCAQRIVDGESKTCPICRRVIHRVRRMFST